MVQRLSNGTQVPTLPVPAAIDGTPGYATGGTPGGGVAASDIDYDQWNQFQEELCGLVEFVGLVCSKTDNTQIRQAVLALIANSLIGKRQQVLDGPATTTWYCPAGITSIYIAELQAGGGASGDGNGGAAGGGSAGGNGRGWVSVTPGQGYELTAGAGGTTVNGEGGFTSFDTIAISTGGNGGADGPNGAGSTSFGTSTGPAGWEAISGESGQNGLDSGGLSLSGDGGGSSNAPGGRGQNTATGNNVPGNNAGLGAGGGGGVGNGVRGNGGSGRIVWWY